MKRKTTTQKHAPKRRRTVFLVDDESPWLEAISDVLKDESYRLITAEGGEAALSKLATKKPDLIISDVRMPVINGFDLFEKVRSNPKLSSVPFVFMSTIDDYDAKNFARQLGADDYVVKPFDPDEAKAIVLDLLSRFQKA